MTAGRSKVWLGAALLVLLWAVWPGTEAPSAGRDAIAPALIETAETTPVEVRVRGHVFIIPLNYFRHPPRRDGEEDNGFFLRALLPNFEPYTPDNAAEFARLGFARKIAILLQEGRNIRPLAEMVHDYLEGNAPSAPTEATYGLAHGIALGVSRGLGDVFVHRREGEVGREGEVDSVLVCSPIQPDRAAYCEHRFSWRVFHVELTYAREMLPQWFAIQKNTEALLATFLRSVPYEAGVAEHSARTTPIVVNVQGQRFRIPDNHLQRVPPRDREEDLGFELELLLPNFEGFSDKNASGFLHDGWKRKVRIALRNASAREETLGLQYASGRDGYDVYAIIDDGSARTVIYCQTARHDPDPSCVTMFQWQGFAAGVEYGRERLGEWQSLKQKAEALLEHLKQNHR